MSRKPVFALVAFGVIVTLLASSVKDPREVHATEGTSLVGLRLSEDSVMMGEELSILGEGLSTFEGLASIFLGEHEVHDKALVSWGDQKIRFQVEIPDPGVFEVDLKPVVSGDLPLVIGQVEVAKYLLPPEGFTYAPGKIIVRLRASEEPSQVTRGDDTFEPVFPKAEGDDPATSWYRVKVPEGSELSRITDYAADERVALAH